MTTSSSSHAHSTPTEHKTVQARILAYAEAIGWTFVPRKEAEHRRGFDPNAPPKERAKNRSLFFDDLLDAKVREFNPRYAEAGGALLGQFRHFHTDIYGNQKFVEYLRNRGTYSDHKEKRERDLILTTIPNLSQSKLAEPPMTLTLLPEQKKIAHILSTIQQKIDNAQSKKNKLQALFRTLIHELMTAKIRVHQYKF